MRNACDLDNPESCDALAEESYVTDADFIFDDRCALAYQSDHHQPTKSAFRDTIIL